MNYKYSDKRYDVINLKMQRSYSCAPPTEINEEDACTTIVELLQENYLVPLMHKEGNSSYYVTVYGPTNRACELTKFESPPGLPCKTSSLLAQGSLGDNFTKVYDSSYNILTQVSNFFTAL